MRKLVSTIVTVLVLSGAGPSSAEPVVTAGTTNRLDMALGLGRLGGTVTYEIGGRTVSAEGVEQLPFPISRLEWPASVELLQWSGRAVFAGAWEIEASAAVNSSSDAGTLNDRDWIDPVNDLTPFIVSRSDAALDVWQAEVELRRWFTLGAMERHRFRWALGLGYRQREFSWEARNIDQWYPTEPARPHDYFTGVGATYDVREQFPYLGAHAELQRGPWLFRAGLKYAPEVSVHDEDDHILRGILSVSDTTGPGWTGELAARRGVSERMWVEASAEFENFDTDGTERNTTYAGDAVGEAWTMQHKVYGRLWSVLLSVGMDF